MFLGGHEGTTLGSDLENEFEFWLIESLGGYFSKKLVKKYYS